jgi:hypothetical protein
MHIHGNLIIGLALSLATLVACGGDDDVGDGGNSGVDGNKAIVSMTEAERTSFCEWAIATQGGAGTVHQCDGFTLTVQSVADCVADFGDFVASCAATVSQGEACVSAISAMPCMPATTACEAIFACIPQ